MDSPIKNYINRIELDRWVELNRTDISQYQPTDRCRSIYCGDGEGDFEKRSYFTTIECLENYMVDCEDQKVQAYEDLMNLRKRLNKQ